MVTGVEKTPEGAAVVTVTDDGGGIPPEFVDQVFARFARADAARTATANGPGAPAAEGTSGVGLSIVESTVEAHGGRVTVTSQPGRTQFTVQLPLLGQMAQDGAP